MSTNPGILHAGADSRDIDAIQLQHMKMQVQIEGIAKALHKGDGAASNLPVGGSETCPTPERTEDRVHEDVQDFTNQKCIVSQAKAQREGKRQYPLTNRHLRDDLIDKVGGGVRHAPATARAAKASPLTGKGNNPILCLSAYARPRSCGAAGKSGRTSVLSFAKTRSDRRQHIVM